MEIHTEPLPDDQSQKPTQPASTSTESIEHLVMARHFNIDTPTQEEDGKLREIWEYGKTLSKTGEMQDTIWQLIHLQRTMGAPRLGEAPLDKIYRWAKLKRQQANIEQELENV